MKRLEPVFAAILAVVGIGMLAYGLWLAWPPLGFIAAGGLMLATDPAWLKRGGRE